MGAALREGCPLVIGRAAPSDVVLADSSLSRAHARVTWQDDALHVEDLGSTNGTFANGQRVDSAVIEPYTEVLLGDVRLLVHHSAFAPARSDRGGEAFTTHVGRELQRARTFRRPFALLAVRCLAPGLRWDDTLAACLRPVDSITAASAQVALIALAEVGREDLSAWAAKLRSGSPDHELRFAAALYPDHGDDPEQLIQAALAALARAPADQVCCMPSHSAAANAPAVVIESPSMKALYNLVARVARTRMPVLILGETGVGKELVARAIHDASPRSRGAFRAVNCATIPAALTESALFGHEKGSFSGAVARTKGLFEDADGGTVFLDEVGELPLPAQAALLRVLEAGCITRVGGTQEIAVDVRVVAATHRDLAAMATNGAFRDDLLYRLDAMTLEVPPLRERVEDIRPLALTFLRRTAEQWQAPALELDPTVLDAFCAYRWPGNVRQLRNTVDRAAAIAVGSRITLTDLPREIASAGAPASSGLPEAAAGRSLTERVAAFEREILRDALARSNGNQCRAAEALGVPRRTLAHKVKRHGLA